MIIMERRVVKTEDGSSTIFVPDLNEHFHSVHGAVQESMHVYIHHGLLTQPLLTGTIRLLEMGFGTGLNALLTYYATASRKKPIEYLAIDAFPLEGEVIKRLNYTDVLDYEGISEFFLRLHNAPWGERTRIDRRFFLTKLNVRVQDVILDGFFNVVYYDAFSPDVQPECWVQEIFSRIFCHMANGGVLVTYSAKGAVRRSLQQAGFSVERLPGPPGKREMLRAVK